MFISELQKAIAKVSHFLLCITAKLYTSVYPLYTRITLGMVKGDALDELALYKNQLCHSLEQVASHMRQCADLASHFSALLKGEPPGAVKDSHTFQNAFAPVPPPNDLQGPPTPIEHQGSAGEKKSRQNASTEGDGGKRKRIKKEKKEKDPDLPKRPPSAYLMFQNEVRAGFKTQFPGLAYHQVLGKISEAWSTMPDKDKERYKDMVSVDKARYDEELNTYNTNKGIKAAEASAAAAIEAGPAVPVAKPKSAVKEVQKETPVSDEDSSSEDDSSDESSEDEQEPEQPPPKKSKKSHDEKKKHSSK